MFILKPATLGFSTSDVYTHQEKRNTKYPIYFLQQHHRLGKFKEPQFWNVTQVTREHSLPKPSTHPRCGPEHYEAELFLGVTSVKIINTSQSDITARECLLYMQQTLSSIPDIPYAPWE